MSNYPYSSSSSADDHRVGDTNQGPPGDPLALLKHTNRCTPFKTSCTSTFVVAVGTMKRMKRMKMPKLQKLKQQARV
jgi:hypothetical protein